MLIGSYRFFCNFQTEARLPAYKGSTLRGVFGRALKDVVCGPKKSECAGCPEIDRCLYVLAFETRLNKRLPRTRHVPEPPPPYVIEPPLDSQSHYLAGEPFEFNLLLFGEINNNLPYFVYAFERIGRKGIGRRVNDQGGTYRVCGVDLFGTRIFDGQSQTFQSMPPVQRLGMASLPSGDLPIESLTLTLRTPLRLKFKNQLHPELPFHVLVRTLLRRAATLLGVYGDGEPPLDYPGLVRRAEEIAIERSTLQWVDWRRYSFRQEAEMSLGGLMGSITYRNVPIDYLPLLQFGALTHFGKETTFGLGKVEIACRGCRGAGG